jgi:hypothetical protein
MHHHRRLAPGVSGNGSVAGTIRRELSSLDPRTPLLSVSTLQAFTEGSPFHWRFRAGARIFTVFGLAGRCVRVGGGDGTASRDPLIGTVCPL